MPYRFIDLGADLDRRYRDPLRIFDVPRSFSTDLPSSSLPQAHPTRLECYVLQPLIGGYSGRGLRANIERRDANPLSHRLENLRARVWSGRSICPSAGSPSPQRGEGVG